MLRRYPTIEALRAAKGLTQQDIAEALGVSRETAGRKLIGKSKFTVSEVLKLKELLGTTATIEELLSDEFPE
ncbi:helix-turn-helix transcriptional regulator [Sharpea azabuensis]|uniref:helix-turn-helix transcriptional regulator n=1 Tax=Sharpea azabuensis TaxID=322505 RepID=UPI001567DBEB|nr:helix-turn-helix transcriptional regulator [Sharpea azabuensis]